MNSKMKDDGYLKGKVDPDCLLRWEDKGRLIAYRVDEGSIRTSGILDQTIEE